jgi:hypothetical protein
MPKTFTIFLFFYNLEKIDAPIKSFQVLFIGILLKANGINIMDTMLCFWIRFNIGGFQENSERLWRLLTVTFNGSNI